MQFKNGMDEILKIYELIFIYRIYSTIYRECATSKKYIEPSGYELHRELLEILYLFDKAYCKGDLPTFIELYRQILKTSSELSSHLKSKKMIAMANFMIDECKKSMKRMECGGGFKELERMAKITMSKYREEL